MVEGARQGAARVLPVRTRGVSPSGPEAELAGVSAVPRRGRSGGQGEVEVCEESVEGRRTPTRSRALLTASSSRIFPWMSAVLSVWPCSASCPFRSCRSRSDHSALTKAATAASNVTPYAAIEFVRPVRVGSLYTRHPACMVHGLLVLPIPGACARGAPGHKQLGGSTSGCRSPGLGVPWTQPSRRLREVSRPRAHACQRRAQTCQTRPARPRRVRCDVLGRRPQPVAGRRRSLPSHRGEPR